MDKFEINRAIREVLKIIKDYPEIKWIDAINIVKELNLS